MDRNSRKQRVGFVTHCGRKWRKEKDWRKTNNSPTETTHPTAHPLLQVKLPKKMHAKKGGGPELKGAVLRAAG